MNDEIVNPAAFAREVLADPSVPYWVKETLRIAAEKDPLDALGGLETLATWARLRFDYVTALDAKGA